jgi:hypothetical protein
VVRILSRPEQLIFDLIWLFHFVLSTFRHCSSWTNKLIKAADHSSMQLNVANIDPVTGRFTGDVKTYAIAGYVRDHVSFLLWAFMSLMPLTNTSCPFFQSESDTALWHLISKGTRNASASS